MTDLRNQRRMAAAMLNVGETRVWIDPLHAEDVAAAVTREDVRGLIGKGYVRKTQATGVSRGRARKTMIQKSKGKRKGPGSREGSAGSMARDPRKQRWMRTIRPLRHALQMLRDEDVIPAEQYRDYYLRAKGGVFRSRAHLLSHMVTEGVLTDAQAKEYRVKAEAARAVMFGQKPAAEREAAERQAEQARRAAGPAKAAKPAKKEKKPKASKAEGEEGEA